MKWSVQLADRECRIPATRRGYWVAKIERNRQRDRRTRRLLRREGWRALVVWECQTTNRRQAPLSTRLRRFLTD
jgi:DNA mismatch endonuclease (patch repair protein)